MTPIHINDMLPIQYLALTTTLTLTLAQPVNAYTT